MWTLDEADDNDCRVLQHTDGTAVTMLPLDQVSARDAPTRADMQRALEAAAQRSRGKIPAFTNDDLDRIRATLGGIPFQSPPTFKRVT